MAHLVPEVRVNKNGVPVTKHVRPDASASSPASSSLGGVLPPAPAAPAPEPEGPMERFDRIRDANNAWQFREEPTVLDREDLRVLGTLVEEMSNRDEDGDTRVYAATYILRSGDAHAARSILRHLDAPDYSGAKFNAIDVWEKASDAGVLQRNRLYDPADPDSGVYGFMLRFYAEAEEHFPLYDAVDNDLCQLAIIHERMPDADPVQMVEIFVEREIIDAESFFAAVGSQPALRSGAL